MDRRLFNPGSAREVEGMKIYESNVSTESSREFTETHSVSIESELTWKRIFNDRQQAYAVQPSQTESLPELDPSGLEAEPVQDAPAIIPVSVAGLSMAARQLAFLTSILESMFSRLISDITYSLTGVRVGAETDASSQEEGQGTTVEYSYRESVVRSHYEQETTRFASNGQVVTDDGRAIDFSLDLEMDREFLSVNSVTRIENGTYTLLDPLVLNFQGEIPELSDTTFFFDLNMDGQEEEIYSLCQGSGFLAMDINGDGCVNDGSELFGTRTDNGFQELAAYDLDHNNWIDENDAVFDSLSVWRTDGDGGDSLVSLRDSGVGAVFLGYESTRFDLTGDDNTLKARVDKTGVFLEENGMAGTVQELKFVV